MPNTTTTGPTTEQLAEQCKAEILNDIDEGVVPADVADFSALHDHVDANEYAGLCAENADVSTEQLIDMQNIVDAWLRAGRPTSPDKAPLRAAITTVVEQLRTHDDDAAVMDEDAEVVEMARTGIDLADLTAMTADGEPAELVSAFRTVLTAAPADVAEVLGQQPTSTTPAV